MPVMDEFKEERESLKNGTPKQKLTYFWDYYKWHVIVAIVAIIVVVTFIQQILNKKDTGFYACMMNGARIDFLNDNPDSINAFAQYADIDVNEEDIFYDTSLQIGMNTGDDVNSSQKFMVYLASSEFDVMVTDAETNLKYAYQGDYFDLREFLTPDQTALYQDAFYYVDGDIIREINEEVNKNNLEYEPVYADALHPETMKDPIPVGLYLPAESPLLKDYFFKDENVVLSVFINTTRPERASAYIDFCMQKVSQ